MIPTHATKAGVRYRYYVSTPCLHGEAKTASAGSVPRVPAADIEDTVVKWLKEHLAARLDKTSQQRVRCAWGIATAELRGQNAVELRAQARPPGTEFLDAETGRQIPPLKCADAHRDPDPGIEWPKIPAETPYQASCRNCTVCKGWMVGAPGLEPGTR
jgi:hypothetical protein